MAFPRQTVLPSEGSEECNLSHLSDSRRTFLGIKDWN